MLFTKMQKYQKAFLIFVTALLAVSFGAGTLITRLLDPANLEVAATLEKGKVAISGNQFRKTYRDWSRLYRLAAIISPKAQKIKYKKGEAPQEFLRLAFSKHSTWDAIFSLSKAVIEIDKKLDQQLGSSYKWRSLIKGELGFMGFGGDSYPPAWEEIQFYQKLPAAKKEEALVFTKKDAWNIIMLLHQAKKWGVEVTNTEVREFVEETQRMFGIDEYYERLRNLGFLADSFAEVAHEALMVLKYLRLRNGMATVTSQAAYQQYSKYYTTTKLQWCRLEHTPFRKEVEKNYQQQRLDFYDQKSKERPDYFQIPAVADFDAVLVKTSRFLAQINVSRAELDAAYQKRHPKSEESDEQKIAQEKMKIAQELRQKKAGEQAKAFLRQIRQKIAALSISVPLATIASHYNLKYISDSAISEEEFLDLEDIGSAAAQRQVYRTLAVGKISPILAGKNGVFFMVRLRKLVAPKKLTRKEVSEDDRQFLQRYYHHNQKDFKSGERYRLAYVIADYATIDKNLLVTTQAMQHFYENYKDQLYKISTPQPPQKKDAKATAPEKKDAKAAPEKKEAVAYRPFAEVKADLEARVANFMKIKEMQKIHVVHEACKVKSKDLDKGKDLNIGAIVKEMARQIMSARDGLQYSEDTQLRTLAEIREDNPTGDPDFPGDLSAKTEISDIKDSSKGKYFYKVLGHQDVEATEFAKIISRVKEHFLKAQATGQARQRLVQLEKSYQQRQRELQRQLSQRIASWKRKKEPTAAPEPQQLQRLENEKKQLPFRLFQLMTRQQNLTCQETLDFEKISEVEALKDVPGINRILNLPRGKTSVVVDGKRGQAILAQLVAKQAPQPEAIEASKLQKIKKLMWQREYRASHARLINYEMLKLTLGLEIKDSEFSEEDYRSDGI